METAQQTTRATLPAGTTVGGVRLRVSDAVRTTQFYRDLLGFDVLNEEAGMIQFGIAGSDDPIVATRVVPGLDRAPRRAAGLYHFAILLPSRPDLARFARHLVASNVLFGQSDHAVSEALYFDDPDGNGIEVYADRPRSEWPMRDGVVAMTGDPIDFDDLFGQITSDDRWSGMPSGTRIGHVHLRVSDLDRSRAFFVETLGFDVMQRSLSGALFISAGGYHHHIGMNTWESQGQSLAGEDVAGLDSFTIKLPDRSSWAAAAERVIEGAPTGDVVRFQDPDGIEIDLAY